METRNKPINLESRIIPFFNNIYIPFARFAIFLIYFWFGLLKVLDLSPATPMVIELLSKTLPAWSVSKFLVFFGLMEMFIGLLFLFPRLTRLALILIFIHLITTFLPLGFMPEYVWEGFLTPTMEGQYIIKNILIIATAFVLGANMKTTHS